MTKVSGSIVMAAAVIILSVALLAGLIAEWCCTTELQCYSIDMEIVNSESITYNTHKSDYNTRRFFYLRNDEKAITVEVDQPTFTLYKEGEWVKVEFQVCERPISHKIIEYVVAIKPLQNLP